MQENIWKPLGMDSTTFRLRDRPDIKSRLSGLTVRLPTGELIDIPRLYPDPAPLDMGGVGAYTSVSDYMKLLTSLLRNDEKLLAKRSVTELFKPQLSDAKHLMANKDRIDAGIWPNGVPLNHSLGGLANMDPFPSGRRKGSMSWMGGFNFFWVSEAASQCVHQLIVVSVDRSRKRALWLLRLADSAVGPDWGHEVHYAEQGV